MVMDKRLQNVIQDPHQAELVSKSLTSKSTSTAQKQVAEIAQTLGIQLFECRENHLTNMVNTLADETLDRKQVEVLMQIVSRFNRWTATEWSDRPTVIKKSTAELVKAFAKHLASLS
jgi:hypothetical protein